MDYSIFLKSLGVGLAVAAPVGPMSVLCMRTTLLRGGRSGFAIGAGIAVGDALFAAIAALGLAGLSSFMLAYEKPLHIAAGLFLLWLGLRSFWRKSDSKTRVVSERSFARDFATSVLLTLTNPPTIIMFAAVFTALAPAEGFDLSGAAATTLGVLIGSALWWVFLVGAVSLFRHAIGDAARRWIDRASGAVLAALGLVELNRGLGLIRR